MLGLPSGDAPASSTRQILEIDNPENRGQSGFLREQGNEQHDLAFSSDMAELSTVAYNSFHAVQKLLRNSSGTLALAGSLDMATQASTLTNGFESHHPGVAQATNSPDPAESTTSKQRESHALTPPLTSESLLFCRKTIYTLT